MEKGNGVSNDNENYDSEEILMNPFTIPSEGETLPSQEKEKKDEKKGANALERKGGVTRTTFSYQMSTTITADRMREVLRKNENSSNGMKASHKEIQRPRRLFQRGRRQYVVLANSY